ncbi:MAG TPA: metal-binding protein [Roseiflexaceae bacterium]|nr:metal-binding protein [Roseiflexaceae bacterium]
MPGVHTHDVITFVTGAALAPLVYTGQMAAGAESSTAMVYSIIAVGAHLISGIMFSPDLDLDSRIDNRWGIFFWIWRPYMWLIPHRHFWSHGLIVPPLLRLLYFYLVIVIFLSGGAWLLSLIGIIIPDYRIRFTDALISVAYDHPRETWWFLVGFAAGGAAHTVADWMVTGGKRYLRRMGFRITHDYSSHDGWRAHY